MSVLVSWLGVVGALVLGVTWLGYPVSIYVLSLFTPRPRRARTAEATVSVIVATRDTPKLVRRRVRNLLRSQYPPEKLEIVVALDAGTDYAPSELMDLTALGRIRVVQGHGPDGKAQALNAGVEGSSGGILVFADTGQRFVPEIISELVSAFSDPTIGGASGSLVLRRRRTGMSAMDAYWRFERWLRKREARIHSPVGVTGAVSALRRSLWRPLPSGLILDDVYTPMRVVLNGYRIAFVESAIARETRRPTPDDERRRKTRTLTGVMQLCIWLPAVVLPWKNPIFLQFFLHKLCRLVTPYALALVILSAIWFLALRLTPLILPLVLITGTILLWVGLGLTGAARRLRSTLLELLLAQVAIVRATANGFRGRWDVWE